MSSDTRLFIHQDDNPLRHPSPRYHGNPALWVGCFEAMAGSCEVLMEGVDQPCFEQAFEAAVVETWRIESKFSRYESNNVMARINASNGRPVELDDETAALLDFADQCYYLSQGLFDVTSGVLRKVWRFDGSDQVPVADAIEALLPFIGWDKVSWQRPMVVLPPGMELDFGGIGKEYAVDRAFLVIRQALEKHRQQNCSYMVNFGGDLVCSGSRLNGAPWVVGVESSERNQQAVATVSLHGGALATSGDSRRFLLKDGVRYSHILNPKTGWALTDAPRAVSVAANACLNAGILSTLALLHGDKAEAFLREQSVQYWIQHAGHSD